MPETRTIVINTGPLIALVAALGTLEVLKVLYARIVVPFEVTREMEGEGTARFGAAQFGEASWLEKRELPTQIPTALGKTLDKGEASVISIAMSEKIATVCIDEALGRRMARLNGLQLTGSLGILLRAKREGVPIALRDAIASMRNKGIWLSPGLEIEVLRAAGEF